MDLLNRYKEIRSSVNKSATLRSMGIDITRSSEVDQDMLFAIVSILMERVKCLEDKNEICRKNYR